MGCQILFSGKNKEIIINFLPAELAQRMLMVNSELNISASRH